MALENDSAYKFRLQDILPEVNVEAFKKNPAKEIKRVLDILLYREDTDDLVPRWETLGKIVIYASKNKKARKLLIRFLSELDMDKIKPDEADWYFCLRRRMYKFGGLLIGERLKIAKEIDKKKGHDIPLIVFDEKIKMYKTEKRGKN